MTGIRFSYSIIHSKSQGEHRYQTAEFLTFRSLDSEKPLFCEVVSFI